MITLNSSIDPSSQYRLLELGPALLQALENDSSLQIKAATDSAAVAICTRSKTFKLRQINQSNTLLLVQPDGDSITAFGTAWNFLEAVEVKASLDLTTVPIYMGDGEISVKDGHVTETVDSLKARLPISDDQFEILWINNLGVEINQTACLMDAQLATIVLNDVLLTAVSKKMKLDNLDRQLLLESTSIEEDYSVVVQVFKRFASLCDTASVQHSFNLQDIAQWYGLQVLRQHAKSTNLSIDQFFRLWKEVIPVNLGIDLDIDYLVGHYVVPVPNTIRYFTASLLSDSPKTRFQQLFSIKSTWDLNEIVPFIEDIRNKSVKMENFIMKYARKKNLGRKVVVSAR